MVYGAQSGTSQCWKRKLNRSERFAAQFGLNLPLVQGPMGGISGPRLVAAVADAGALGILPIWHLDLQRARAAIAETFDMTKRTFAVNIRADLHQQNHIACALDAGVTAFHLFWGDPAASMAAIRQGSGRMIATVSDADTTKAALDSGALALIAQGVEAGGHVFGSAPLDALLDEVLTLAGNTPVIAAGGLTDSGDVVNVLDQGAAGALLGTRFVATPESDAHEVYHRALISAQAEDTVRTCCFDISWPNAPHRVLRNSTYRRWEEAGMPAPGARPGEHASVATIAGRVEFPRYHAHPPTKAMTGDVEAMTLYAGTGVAKIASILPAAEIVREIGLALAQRPQR